MKWMRPSGNEIETNDAPATIAHGLKSKWEPLEELPEGAEAPEEEEAPIDNAPENVFKSPDGTYSAEYDGVMHNFATIELANEAVEREADRVAEEDEAEDDFAE